MTLTRQCCVELIQKLAKREEHHTHYINMFWLLLVIMMLQLLKVFIAVAHHNLKLLKGNCSKTAFSYL